MMRLVVCVAVSGDAEEIEGNVAHLCTVGFCVQFHGIYIVEGLCKVMRG